MVISRLGHRSILYMLGSRLSRAAASSNRCIMDSKGLSSLISLASSTKALGIDFLPGADMNAWGEHYLNGAKHSLEQVIRVHLRLSLGAAIISDVRNFKQ